MNRWNWMTALVAFAMLCTMGLVNSACSAEQLSKSPEQAATFEQLQADHQAAVESGDEARIHEAEAALARFEAQLLKQRYGLVMEATRSVPVVGPWLAMLGPLAAPLVPLLGKRGRRHYANAIKELNPFAEGKTGGSGHVSPVEAGRDVLRALGVMHSSKASEAAADGAA